MTKTTAPIPGEMTTFPAAPIPWTIQDWIDYCLKNAGKQVTVPLNLHEKVQPKS